jgi:hypothetical protein
MEKQAIKDLLYGGINELMQNRHYYYDSSVGQHYSHWTDEGKDALMDFMKQITHYIYESDQNRLTERAKELVMKELKS